MSQNLSRLSKELTEAGYDAFFAWSPVAMGYLHGFREGAGERFMALGVNSNGKCTLICPALSANQATRLGIADVRPWKDGENPLALFDALAKEWNLGSGIVAVDDEMPAAMLLAMQNELPAALFKAGGSVLGELMRKKSPEEIELMRKAGAIADNAFAAGLAMVKPGSTEQDVARALSNEMARLGGTPTFAIVATGANGAEPHHHTDSTPIREGDIVIIDFGCDFQGYQSDITRTVACGEPEPEAKKVYDIVFRAHHAARRAIRAGAESGSVDAAARNVIEAAGYGEQFMHRTGHGIGTKVHEEPNIIAGSTNVLQPGDCFSIEPGIYLAGRFGVRIENIVTCTESGHESLNAEPAEMMIIAG